MKDNHGEDAYSFGLFMALYGFAWLMAWSKICFGWPLGIVVPWCSPPGHPTDPTICRETLLLLIYLVRGLGIF